LSAHAIERYLAGHAEPEAAEVTLGAQGLSHVLTVVAHDEDVARFGLLETLPVGGGVLAIVLVNDRDDCGPDAIARTRAFHAGLLERYGPGRAAGGGATEHATAFGALLLMRRSADTRPLPARQGVGLARKIVCDVALSLAAGGQLETELIHVTDADAQLPSEYFERLAPRGGAPLSAVYPFVHVGDDPTLRSATMLHELWLRHYVVGLQRAGSPYAMHTIGSTLAISTGAYAAVRGFPRRHGAEDFYLLNKAAKVGPVERLGGAPITLRDRASDRVPFGTGPAVQRIVAGEAVAFHHPRCFELLAELLSGLRGLARDGGTEVELPSLLCPSLSAAHARRMVASTGIEGALPAALARPDVEARLRHLHDHFDALRTLKFVRGLREVGLPEQPPMEAVVGLLGGGQSGVAEALEGLRAVEASECRGDVGPTCRAIGDA